MKNYLSQDKLINVEEPHCYFIPFSNVADCFMDRTNSDRFFLLNGEWKISAYESLDEVQTDFYLNKCEKTIKVPGVIQLFGLDNPAYLNITYPIPFNPPHVPSRNKCFHYQKEFMFSSNKEKDYFLNFEGVDSCFYLYVNNKFVGYSYVTHHISSFNISKYLKKGSNKIDLLVCKWCIGTYCEDQDKIRFSGIIRDVYILTRDHNSIVDYKIETSYKGELRFTLLKGRNATLTFDKETKEVEEGKTVIFRVKNPKLWSAEEPNLYNLVINSQSEFIGEKVGFCSSYVKNGLYFFNGKNIKIYGINRHDTSQFNGAAVTEEEIKEDLLLMKKLNINAIRTSHYPSSPYFYKLCDELGFYVMSESDLETHGAVWSSFDGDFFKDYSRVATDPQFKNQFVLRQQLNVIVNKNHPSIFMWSVGNECGYGQNIIEASNEIRKYDSRPVHYEGISCLSKKDKEEAKQYYDSPFDVVSMMYPPYDFKNGFFNDKKENRPLIICEYSHAMGNSPADIKDYWDVFETSKRLIGGFVWEWKDHSLLINNKLLYGGDFGEKYHDGNFCVDGLITSDCKITQKSLELKKIYQQFKLDIEEEKLTVTSKFFFKHFYGKLNLVRKSNGIILSTQVIDFDLAPQEAQIFKIEKADLVIATILENNEEIAFESHNFVEPETPTLDKYNNNIVEDSRFILINSKGVSFKLDKLSGNIVSIKKDKVELLKSEVLINCFRAPTDNDTKISWKWKETRYDNLESYITSRELKGDVVVFKGFLSGSRFEPILNFELKYTFSLNSVNVSFKYKMNGTRWPFLPRIGLSIELDREFNKVKYYGYGPNESYIDKHNSCIKDFYCSSVEKLENSYLKPQENGSHYGCKYFSVESSFAALECKGDSFSFSCLPHSVSEYAKAKHNYELIESKSTYLNLDFFMSGIGSNSCGPELKEEYRVPSKGENSFTIYIK